MREINGKYEGFIAELVNEIAQKEGRCLRVQIQIS